MVSRSVIATSFLFLNVFRMMNVDGVERAYVARKTHYWWLNNLRVDHRKAS